MLVAAADLTDPRHNECAELLEQDVGPLVTSAMVMAEAAYLLERDLGWTPSASTRSASRAETPAKAAS